MDVKNYDKMPTEKQEKYINLENKAYELENKRKGVLRRKGFYKFAFSGALALAGYGFILAGIVASFKGIAGSDLNTIGRSVAEMMGGLAILGAGRLASIIAEDRIDENTKKKLSKINGEIEDCRAHQAKLVESVKNEEALIVKE